MTQATNRMILSLTDQIDNPVSIVGGKAGSLMKLYSIDGLSQYVPAGFALTVDFFSEWVDTVIQSTQYQEALGKLNSSEGLSIAELTKQCDRVKEYCQTLELSPQQQAAIDRISQDMQNGSWKLPLAAVRSSAPEEDGTGASFAGAFETVLGVRSEKLVDSVIRCFASLFDYRVFSYISSSSGGSNRSDHNNKVSNDSQNKPAFAVVVMEMIDSEMAGVAFSVNPINSDLDELVVDCSYGLGESVVDGSVVADRYVYNKVDQKMIEVVVGSKKQEKRLDCTDGGSQVKSVTQERQQKRTLSDDQFKHLCSLVCTIEREYSLPMDVEFAFSKGSNNSGLELKLLQARPITTTFTLDEELLTKPGERRVLYYDFNVASEATTTEPFTHMDLDLFNLLMGVLLGKPNYKFLTNNPEMPIFEASTRQYINMSVFFRWFHPKRFSKEMQVLDPYLARTFESSDCDRKKYRAKKRHKDINLRNFMKVLRMFQLGKYYKISRKYMSNPNEAIKQYIKTTDEAYTKIAERRAHGIDREKGLSQYNFEMFSLMMPAFDEEMGMIYFGILPTIDKLDKKRRYGKTEEIRKECEALCGGYEGDPLMEENIAIYQLAQSLPLSIWDEYDHSSFDKLSERIQDNLDGKIDNLPSEFLEKWTMFMKEFGYNGTPQIFVSAPRYIKRPDLLLAVASHGKGEGVMDPAKVQEEKLAARREAMAQSEGRAKKKLNPWALSKIQKRNEILENVMWIRNRPKLHLSLIVGMIQEAVVPFESEFISKGRLEQTGDIFHLSVEEFDEAIVDESMDLMSLVRPRRARYEQAKKANICPMLVDSRNRILRPDVINVEGKPGTLVGSAISPGVATGRVRIVNGPLDQFETGEVLVAVVTDPAWTPLFIGASAVIFQIGGVLQHGALCAREYGKPGVSGIEIHSKLKNGMMVSVDGNTGVVTILDNEAEEK